jgi:hypothetical protein
VIAYSVVLVKSAGAPAESLVVSDPEELALEAVGSWAILRDSAGVALMLPAQQVHSITRIDEPHEPPPTGQETTEPAPGR